jgi:hypothetical protein
MPEIAVSNVYEAAGDGRTVEQISQWLKPTGTPGGSFNSHISRLLNFFLHQVWKVDQSYRDTISPQDALRTLASWHDGDQWNRPASGSNGFAAQRY